MTTTIKAAGQPTRKSLACVGKKYNRLLVLSISRVRGGKTRTMALCRCDCGAIKEADFAQVSHGAILSCGCLRSELRAINNHRHGMTNSPEYGAWQSMRDRCMSPSNKAFKNYGGRGISVCERWEDFSLFIKDMGPRPPGLSLERKEVNGNYEPSNCKWATRAEQSRNKRNTKVSMEVALRVLEMRASGMSRKDMAAASGLTVGNVDAVIYKMKPRVCSCPKCGHEFAFTL